VLDASLELFAEVTSAPAAAKALAASSLACGALLAHHTEVAAPIGGLADNFHTLLLSFFSTLN